MNYFIEPVLRYTHQIGDSRVDIGLRGGFILVWLKETSSTNRIRTNILRPQPESLMQIGRDGVRTFWFSIDWETDKIIDVPFEPSQRQLLDFFMCSCHLEQNTRH